MPPGLVMALKVRFMRVSRTFRLAKGYLYVIQSLPFSQCAWPPTMRMKLTRCTAVQVEEPRWFESKLTNPFRQAFKSVFKTWHARLPRCTPASTLILESGSVEMPSQLQPICMAQNLTCLMPTRRSSCLNDWPYATR